MSSRSRAVLISATLALVLAVAAVVVLLLVQRDDPSPSGDGSDNNNGGGEPGFTADAGGYVSLACSINDDQLAGEEAAWFDPDDELFSLMRAELELFQAAGALSETHGSYRDSGRDLLGAVNRFNPDGVRADLETLAEDCAEVDRVPTDAAGRTEAVCAMLPRIRDDIDSDGDTWMHEVGAVTPLSVGTDLHDGAAVVLDAIARLDEPAIAAGIDELLTECPERE